MVPDERVLRFRTYVGESSPLKERLLWRISHQGPRFYGYPFRDYQARIGTSVLSLNLEVFSCEGHRRRQMEGCREKPNDRRIKLSGRLQLTDLCNEKEEVKQQVFDLSKVDGQSRDILCNENHFNYCILEDLRVNAFIMMKDFQYIQGLGCQ